MVETVPETSPTPEAEQAALVRRQRWILAGVIVAALLLLAGIVAAVVFLSRDSDVTANIRDIFIIFMAFESLVIGAALIILIVQMASLINLIQNEVRPILDATNETVNTLRGTTEFLSENLVEPVIKLNSSLAGMRRFFEMFGLRKK